MKIRSWEAEAGMMKRAVRWIYLLHYHLGRALHSKEAPILDIWAQIYSPFKNIHPWKYSLLKNIHPRKYSPLKKIHFWKRWVVIFNPKKISPVYFCCIFCIFQKNCQIISKIRRGGGGQPLFGKAWKSHQNLRAAQASLSKDLYVC